jgi:hypothetical protein
MDEWLAEHDETIDDWLGWSRETWGDPQFIRVDEDVVERPAAFLKSWRDV